jgi:hypothetical protein
MNQTHFKSVHYEGKLNTVASSHLSDIPPCRHNTQTPILCWTSTSMQVILNQEDELALAAIILLTVSKRSCYGGQNGETHSVQG